jgi:hypothetical protein
MGIIRDRDVSYDDDIGARGAMVFLSCLSFYRVSQAHETARIPRKNVFLATSLCARNIPSVSIENRPYVRIKRLTMSPPWIDTKNTACAYMSLAIYTSNMSSMGGIGGFMGPVRSPRWAGTKSGARANTIDASTDARDSFRDTCMAVHMNAVSLGVSMPNNIGTLMCSVSNTIVSQQRLNLFFFNYLIFESLMLFEEPLCLPAPGDVELPAFAWSNLECKRHRDRSCFKTHDGCRSVVGVSVDAALHHAD